MKIAFVIGVRPHYVKLASLYSKIYARHDVVIISTGQHHDHQLSQAFIDEFRLPRPHFELTAEGGSRARQLGSIIAALEAPLASARPDVVVIFGDANTSLAGALTAAVLELPVLHVEAGLRCSEKGLPEENNRRAIDAIAAAHLCPTARALRNMELEMRGATSSHVGDILLDRVDQEWPRVEERLVYWQSHLPRLRQSAIVTFHRAATLRDRTKLEGVVEGLLALGRPLICLLHPGTRRVLEEAKLLERLESASGVTVLGAMGHADVLALMAGAERVLSDSNGIQRESLFVGTPCFILREDTEYPESIELGGAALVGTDPGRIAASTGTTLTMPGREAVREVFGGGRAADRIAEHLGRDAWGG